jgi:intracellular multiplication protein IcmK
MKCLKLHKIGLISLCLSAPLLSHADAFLDQTLPAAQTPATSTDSSDQTAAPTNAASPTDANNAAFQQLLNSYFPLTPDQIHQFKNATAVQQEANAAPPGESPPEGTSSIIPVTLKPGGIMPVIRVGRAMITSLVITDASGQVWPITSYSIGDPNSFAVQWDKASGVLMIQGQKLYAQTNIGIMLQGMQVPIMLTLLIGQNKWDYLDYVQLDQNQPGDTNTPQPVSQAPAYLVDLLNGIPPQGATPLTVSDNNAGQVWSYGGQYIMLTKATLLSPAWTSLANGPGPTPFHAYALSPAPELLISNMGNLQKLLVNPGNQNAQSDQ